MKRTYESFDVETTGLNAYNGDKIFAYCIGHSNGDVEVYRFDGKDGKSPKKARKRLQQFFDDTSIVKIAHNYKFELGMLLTGGIRVPKKTIWHDTMIMSMILRNLNPSHSLGYLAWQLAGWPQDLDKKIERLAKEYGGYHKISEPLMKKYQESDAQRTTLLWEAFKGPIRKNPEIYADYRNEIRVIRTTQKMEQGGILVDEDNCHELIEELESKLDKNQINMFNRVGHFVNMGSNPQVMNLLFKRLKLPPVKIKEETGNISTDKDVILFLKEKFPKVKELDLILKHRSYTDGLSNVKDYLERKNKDGIIFPNINTNGARRTGRQSATKPNLQNVSKAPPGPRNPFPVAARKCFRARPGYILLLPDYAGIELRLICNSAGEMELIKIFNNGGDAHIPGVEILYEKQFTKEKNKEKKKAIRGAGKNANFAIPYGASPDKIAKTLNLPLSVVIPRLKNYKTRFPKYYNFRHIKSAEVKKRGYIVTPFGRRLYVDRSKPYVGANYDIQGTAAGVLKRAENRIDKYLDSPAWRKTGTRMVIPIHDEQIFEYPRKCLPNLRDFCHDVGALMVDMKEITVKLEVEWKMSTYTWADAKEFNPEDL